MDSRFEMVGDTNELAPGQMKRVSVKGRPLLIVNAQGDFFAIDEMCSHEDYSLSYGCIKDRTIKCSLHGSHFDLLSGMPLEEPATDPIRTYTVEIQDGRIWVALS